MQKPRTGDAGPPTNLPALDDRGGATSKAKSPKAQSRRAVSVYDGRQCVGHVVANEHGFAAIDPHGRAFPHLFATQAVAMRALPGRAPAHDARGQTEHALRHFLKTALRTYGLRCIAIVPEIPSCVEDSENGSREA
jgi:hypothetical protein